VKFAVNLLRNVSAALNEAIFAAWITGNITVRYAFPKRRGLAETTVKVVLLHEAQLILLTWQDRGCCLSKGTFL
jgi:hypothetical protein